MIFISYQLRFSNIESIISFFSQVNNIWFKNINDVKIKNISKYILENKVDKKTNIWKNLIKTWDNLKWIILSGDIWTIENITFWSLMSMDFWKNVLLNEIKENENLWNKSICEIIVWTIKQKNLLFEFIIIFFISYMILWILLFIFSFINFLLFKIMNLFKIYQLKIIVDDVEIIE